MRGSFTSSEGRSNSNARAQSGRLGQSFLPGPVSANEKDEPFGVHGRRTALGSALVSAKTWWLRSKARILPSLTQASKQSSKEEYSEQNIATSLTFDDTSTVMSAPAQKRFFERFRTLKSKIPNLESDSARTIAPSGQANYSLEKPWTQDDREVSDKLFDLLDPVKHELIVKPRGTANAKLVNPSLTIVALSRNLTHTAVADLIHSNNPSVSKELKESATNVIMDSPLKGFGALLCSGIHLSDLTYHDLSKLITVFTEGKEDWKFNSSLPSRPDNSLEQVAQLANIFKVGEERSNSTALSTTEERLHFGESLFSKQNSKIVEDFANKVDKMTKPLTLGILDYSTHFEDTDTGSFRPLGNKMQYKSFAPDSNWNDATGEQLSELLLTNGRKKIVSLDSDFKLEYEEPSKPSQKFTKKSSGRKVFNKFKGTNPQKYKMTLPDIELIRLFAESIAGATSSKGEFRGMAGFQSKRYSEQRLKVAVGITYMIRLKALEIQEAQKDITQ